MEVFVSSEGLWLFGIVDSKCAEHLTHTAPILCRTIHHFLSVGQIRILILPLMSEETHPD